ncbi:HAMP domain-containing sensor histidine kinase [Neobacillus sp.]|uniref:sensor histidine kinase n=1 Tax=Neobacillus sp. TaxID=2675273 RepID=UPI002897D1ED|nr:HAMP domain-containing sensor histidine kinase [Neobacillus sp.]
MVYIALISIVVAVFFLTRFYLLKKEIKRATKQLNELNSKKTEKKIDFAYFDKDFEKLAREINVQIDFTLQAYAEKRRKENELKQAVANISHDIRTPMTSILGYIQFLESDELSSEKRTEYITIIKSGALRLKVLLEDFFELSLIESEDYSLKMEKIKLHHLLLEVLVVFYEQFNQQNLEPVLHIPEEEISIIADPSAVKRVIENLVHNAIKHSNGNVTIRLEKLHSSIKLTISNTVSQLSENDIIFLFDRFYKADKTRSEKGTGLGLSIAKSLMLKMHGKLTAELKDNELSMICEWEK